MRILAFRHAPAEDLGTIRPVLESRGIEVACVDLYAGAEMPDASTAAGLIFMGGAMCANDDLPFLRSELELIGAAARRGQPLFGVCLGAQLIAKALGGTVYPNAVEEIGWLDIHLTGAAASDPLFSGVAPIQKVFHLHQDTFDLPSGATLLASSELCASQAFRYGRSIYGLQFHAEMTPGMIAEWQRELSLPAFEEPPGACSDLSVLSETLVGRWSEFL